jgi:hypothetical protein
MVSGINHVEIGSMNMGAASQEPGFIAEQEAAQQWKNNCMGQCHYADAAEVTPDLSTSSKPDTPLTDIYSEGMAEVLSGITEIATGASVISSIPTPAKGYGGRFLNLDDEIVIFEQSPGSGRIKPYDPMGNSAQNLSVVGSPEEAHIAAFQRAPNPGDPYWKTTAGKIGATGRYPYWDMNSSPGHVSIYGGNPRYKDPLEFFKIWDLYFFE